MIYMQSDCVVKNCRKPADRQCAARCLCTEQFEKNVRGVHKLFGSSCPEGESRQAVWFKFLNQSFPLQKVSGVPPTKNSYPKIASNDSGPAQNKPQKWRCVECNKNLCIIDRWELSIAQRLCTAQNRGLLFLLFSNEVTPDEFWHQNHYCTCGVFSTEKNESQSKGKKSGQHRSVNVVWRTRGEHERSLLMIAAGIPQTVVCLTVCASHFLCIVQMEMLILHFVGQFSSLKGCT